MKWPGTGTISGANVDDVVVTCANNVTDRIFADGFELPVLEAGTTD